MEYSKKKKDKTPYTLKKLEFQFINLEAEFESYFFFEIKKLLIKRGFPCGSLQFGK